MSTTPHDALFKAAFAQVEHAFLHCYLAGCDMGAELERWADRLFEASRLDDIFAP